MAIKLGLLDAHDDNYNDIAAISDPNRVAYCEKHGIDFIRYRFGQLDPPGRQPNWGKIQGLIKHLPDYDWIFYMDTDAIITNMDIDLRSMIDERYDLIAGIIPETEGGHLSTGAFFVKNCPWSYVFLQELWDRTEFINEPYHGTLSGPGGYYFEQSAFHYLYDNRPDHRAHIDIVSRVKFNSHLGFHEPDHFLVHFPGRVYKSELMKLCLEGKYDEARHEAFAKEQDVMQPYQAKEYISCYLRRNKMAPRAKTLAKPKLCPKSSSVTQSGATENSTTEE